MIGDSVTKTKCVTSSLGIGPSDLFPQICSLTFVGSDPFRGKTLECKLDAGQNRSFETLEFLGRVHVSIKLITKGSWFSL